MKQWGTTLIFIGLGSFVLPMIGLQFRLLNLFGGKPAAGIFIAAVGGILLVMGFIKERAKSSAILKSLPDPKERQVSPQPSSVSQPRSQPITAGLRCSVCGNANAQGDQFCGSCGTTLTAVAPPSAQTCAHCGTPVSAGEGFCGECGTAVSEVPIDQKPIAQIEHSTVAITPASAGTERKRGSWLRLAATVSVLLLGGVGLAGYLSGNGFQTFLIRQAGEAARALDLWHLFTPHSPSELPAPSQQKTETSAPNVSVPTSGSTKREAQSAPAKTDIAATKSPVNGPIQSQRTQSEQARIQPETETARPKTEEERPRRQPIQMGVSTRSEVEQVFGQPIAQLNDSEYEYKPPPSATKLYVQYQSRSGVAERIVWDLPEPRRRAAMVQSLKLPQQSLGTRLTAGDHLAEYFGAPSFMALRYSSKEISSTVISMAYYSAEAFQRVVPVARRSNELNTRTEARGFIGAQVQNIGNPQMRVQAEKLGYTGHTGVLVKEVNQGSPAAVAGGLKSGDIIIAVNGDPVEDAQQFVNAVGQIVPGTIINFIVFRDGKNQKVSFALGTRPN